MGQDLPPFRLTKGSPPTFFLSVAQFGHRNERRSPFRTLTKHGPIREKQISERLTFGNRVVASLGPFAKKNMEKQICLGVGDSAKAKNPACVSTRGLTQSVLESTGSGLAPAEQSARSATARRARWSFQLSWNVLGAFRG